MAKDWRERTRSFIWTDIMLEEGAPRIGPDTQLAGGAIDSLGILQLVAFLQEEFEIRFEEAEVNLENFRTMADVERAVEARIAATSRRSG
jgi:acyl carrier protein